MTRLNAAKLLTPLQWSLAVVAFESGLVRAGLSDPELVRQAQPGQGSWGLLQALAAVLVVVPSVTGFLPRLAPLASAGLAVTFAGAAVGLGPAVGPGAPLVPALLALGFALVAAGRAFAAPVTPLALEPERTDPWCLPAELVERRRRSVSRRPVQPLAPAVQALELVARRVEADPSGPPSPATPARWTAPVAPPHSRAA